MICEHKIGEAEERVKYYRQRIGEFINQIEYKQLFREILLDERRWLAFIIRDHKIHCLGEQHLLLKK